MHPVIIAEEEDETNEVETDATAEATGEVETDATETDVSAETTGEAETEVVLGKIVVANVTVDRAKFDQRVPEVPSADPKGNPMGTRTTAAQRKSVAHETMTIEGAEHGRGPLPRRLGSPE